MHKISAKLNKTNKNVSKNDNLSRQVERQEKLNCSLMLMLIKQ